MKKGRCKLFKKVSVGCVGRAESVLQCQFCRKGSVSCVGRAVLVVHEWQYQWCKKRAESVLQKGQSVV